MTVSSIPFICSTAITVLSLLWLAWLARQDSAARRIPTYLVGLGIVLASMYSFSEGACGRAVCAGLCLFACYLIPYVMGAGIGGGDVKAAFPIGMFVGALGWAAWWCASVGAFLVTACVGIGQRILLRLSTQFSHTSAHDEIHSLTIPHGVSLAVVTGIILISHYLVIFR